MKVNYTEPFNFKPIPCITPMTDYWQNGTWKFGSLEITPDTAYQPSFIDIILKGNTALTLVNAKANSLQYLKLYGECEQSGTPTPDNPIDIVSNNGVLKVSMQLLVNGNLANGTTNWDTAVGVVYTDTTDYAQFYNNSSGFVYCRCLPPTRVAGHKYAYMLKGYASLQSGNSAWGSRNAGSFGLMHTTDTLLAGIDEFPTGGGGNPWVSLPVGVTVYINKSAGFRMYDLTALGLDTTITTAEDVINYFGETYEEPKQIKVSGTVETVEVHGKNLLNINRDSATVSGLNVSTNNQTLTVTGTQSQSFANISLTNNGTAVNVASILTASSGVKKFNKDITYTIKFSDYSDIYDVKIVKYDKSTQTTILLTNGVATFTPTYDVCDIWIRISGNNTARNISTTVMLELGDTATTYEPYYDGGTATATNLLGVLNKSGQNIYAQDVQNVTTGAVTRNVGVRVFDGTETWTKALNLDADGHNVFYIALTDRKINDTNIGMVCSHYKFKGTVSYSTLKTGEMAILQSVSSAYFDGGSATTVTAWTNFVKEQFANGTPITLVYPLATATTETVTAQPLTIQAGTNVIEITQASIDGLELEAKYKAGVTVTIEEIEDAQLDNNVEVTIQ